MNHGFVAMFSHFYSRLVKRVPWHKPKKYKQFSWNKITWKRRQRVVLFKPWYNIDFVLILRNQFHFSHYFCFSIKYKSPAKTSYMTFCGFTPFWMCAWVNFSYNFFDNDNGIENTFIVKVVQRKLFNHSQTQYIINHNSWRAAISYNIRWTGTGCKVQGGFQLGNCNNIVIIVTITTTTIITTMIIIITDDNNNNDENNTTTMTMTMIAKQCQQKHLVIITMVIMIIIVITTWVMWKKSWRKEHYCLKVLIAQSASTELHKQFHDFVL